MTKKIKILQNIVTVNIEKNMKVLVLFFIIDDLVIDTATFPYAEKKISYNEHWDYTFQPFSLN
jgi:hypothetical protein